LKQKKIKQMKKKALSLLLTVRKHGVFQPSRILDIFSQTKRRKCYHKTFKTPHFFSPVENLGLVDSHNLSSERSQLKSSLPHVFGGMDRLSDANSLSNGRVGKTRGLVKKKKSEKAKEEARKRSPTSIMSPYVTAESIPPLTLRTQPERPLFRM
jgi:hypothetical protein